MALMVSFSFVSCSKDEVKKNLQEATEMDFTKFTKTWDGKYASGKDTGNDASLTTPGQITISGDKKGLTIDTKDVKGIKLTVEENTLLLVKAKVEKDEKLGVEGGTFLYTTVSDTFPVVLTVNMKEDTHSFFFKANKIEKQK